MFHYEKKLQFPVKITTPNPKLAAFIISQYGGPYSIRLQKAAAIAPAFSAPHYGGAPRFAPMGLFPGHKESAIGFESLYCFAPAAISSTIS